MVENNDWHLRKEISVGVIVGLVIQTIALITFFVRLDSRVEVLETFKVETASNRFTSSDAEMYSYRITENTSRIAENKKLALDHELVVAQITSNLNSITTDIALIKQSMQRQGYAMATVIIE